MSIKRLLLLLPALLVSGCGGERAGDSARDPSPPAWSGVYSGVFPCDGCPGIPTTLWLRTDGSFFLYQNYPADDEREAMDVYSLGRWSASDAERSIELAGAGPRRVFTRAGNETIEMRTSSSLQHRLTRDPEASPFSATIRLSGEVRRRGDSAVFVECLSGLETPFGKEGDFSRFWHQYRSVGRVNEPTYVELEGRFSWSADGAPHHLTIERFITIKADGAC